MCSVSAMRCCDVSVICVVLLRWLRFGMGVALSPIVLVKTGFGMECSWVGLASG